jgi:hypothetical protein
MKESEREKDRTHNERFGAMAGVPRLISGDKQQVT